LSNVSINGFVLGLVMSNKGWFMALAGAIVGAAIVVGYAEISSRTPDTAPPIAAATSVVSLAVAQDAAPAKAVPSSRTEMQMSFAPVVKSVTPSVVNVYATTIQ
jgi:S1-C subfamily serine protease